MNLQLRVIQKLERQVAVISFVEEVLELLEKESPPVVHLNCNKKTCEDEMKMKFKRNLRRVNFNEGGRAFSRQLFDTYFKLIQILQFSMMGSCETIINIEI